MLRRNFLHRTDSADIQRFSRNDDIKINKFSRTKKWKTMIALIILTGDYISYFFMLIEQNNL